MTPRAENLTIPVPNSPRVSPSPAKAAMGYERYALFTALTTSVACGSRWPVAVSCALPVVPGAIWKRHATQWREERQRQAGGESQPASSRAAPRRPPAGSQQAAEHARRYRATLRRRGGPAQQLAAFQAALPGSRGATYLQQRGIPLALAQQCGGLCSAGHLAA